jgi:hypothetical protein
LVDTNPIPRIIPDSSGESPEKRFWVITDTAPGSSKRNLPGKKIILFIEK